MLTGAGVANYTRISGDNSIVQNVSHMNTPHPMHFYGVNVTVDNVLIGAFVVLATLM